MLRKICAENNNNDERDRNNHRLDHLAAPCTACEPIASVAV